MKLDRAPWSLAAGICLAGCLAAPPRKVEAASGWQVRSASAAEAADLARDFERLAPRLEEVLPDWRLPETGQIWIQDEPRLYAFPRAAKSEAEGLWSESERCILLARGADDIERTLAHEMVHAGLGASWSLLPGSLEEGLCDWVAAATCSEGSARLRAGRLSSALLALGGLELDVRLEPREGHGGDTPVLELGARIVLTSEGEPLVEDDHLGVFRLQAGLSTTRLAVADKRNYYGLAYFLIDRVTTRVGLAGLHELCLRAAERGLTSVPATWLLEAADLTSEAGSWREAALAALGPAELCEILRMYPDFVVAALVRATARARGEGPAEAGLARVTADVRAHGGSAGLDAARVDFIAERVLQRFESAEGRSAAYALLSDTSSQ